MLLVKTAVWMAAVVLTTTATSFPVKATTVLPASNFSCAYSSMLGSGSCAGDASALPVLNGIQGVAFSTDGPVGLDVLGSSIIMTSSGDVSGLEAGLVIPLSWDFVISFDANISEMWTLDFLLLDLNSDGSLIASASANGTGLGTFTGTASWTTAGSSTDVEIETILTLGSAVGQTGELSVNILPGSSLDINALPEPGTIGLLASGLACLGWQFRRRRNTTAPSV
jgi:hypothetical protein